MTLRPRPLSPGPEVASDDGHDEALDAVSLALSINPNSVRAHAVKGTILVFTGQCSQGRHELLTALRLSPRDPFNATMLSHIATSYYLERDYLGAFEASRRVVSRFPKYPSVVPMVARRRSVNSTVRRRHAHRYGEQSKFRVIFSCTCIRARRGIEPTTTNTCSKGFARQDGRGNEGLSPNLLP